MVCVWMERNDEKLLFKGRKQEPGISKCMSASVFNALVLLCLAMLWAEMAALEQSSLRLRPKLIHQADGSVWVPSWKSWIQFATNWYGMLWATVIQKPKAWIRVCWTSVNPQCSDQSSVILSLKQAAHQWVSVAPVGVLGCLWPCNLMSLATLLLCRQKRMWEGTDITMTQAVSCMYSRYWKTLLCRKWSGTRAAWSPACVSSSPGWSLSWYGGFHGLSALFCCLLSHPTLLTLHWESGLIRHVNRPLWLADRFVEVLVVNVEENWVGWSGPEGLLLCGCSLIIRLAGVTVGCSITVEHGTFPALSRSHRPAGHGYQL